MCTRPLLLPLLCLFFVSTLTAKGQTDDDNTVALHEDEGLQQMDVEDNSGVEEEGAIPGRKYQDYPAYTVVPTTTFTCTDRLVPGYYADPDTRCQVFHICGVGGAKHSFLCPEGSVFNQLYLVCDWWYRVSCGETLFGHSIEDIQYSDSFPLDEDADIFQRIETGSSDINKLENPNNDNEFVM